jgi:hypothetical protein
MLQNADDHKELCGKALAALRADTLPCATPQQIWGGIGCGDPCPVCGDALKPSELELELAFGDDDDEHFACVLHMHVRCFAAWEMARKSVAKTRGKE